MRKQTEDLTGQRYGKLLVVERTENDKNYIRMGGGNGR